MFLGNCPLNKSIFDSLLFVSTTFCVVTGKLPMRRLVYRVQPLPQSMLPLVWDFGQLDLDTEKQYIQEMVNKCVSSED